MLDAIRVVFHDAEIVALLKLIEVVSA